MRQGRRVGAAALNRDALRSSRNFWVFVSHPGASGREFHPAQLQGFPQRRGHPDRRVACARLKLRHRGLADPRPIGEVLLRPT